MCSRLSLETDWATEDDMPRNSSRYRKFGGRVLFLQNKPVSQKIIIFFVVIMLIVPQNLYTTFCWKSVISSFITWFSTREGLWNSWTGRVLKGLLITALRVLKKRNAVAKLIFKWIEITCRRKKNNVTKCFTRPRTRSDPLHRRQQRNMDMRCGSLNGRVLGRSGLPKTAAREAAKVTSCPFQKSIQDSSVSKSVAGLSHYTDWAINVL